MIQERNMKKAVNDGIRNINRSYMNAALLMGPENSPFLYEQWQLLNCANCRIETPLHSLLLLSVPGPNVQNPTLSRGDFLIKKFTTWWRGCGCVKTPGMVDRSA